MASNSIELAAHLVGKLLVQEIQYLAEVNNKVSDLRSELECMQCFLWDADEKQKKVGMIRKWVSEVRDSALEAEDIIERYILRVRDKRQNTGICSDLKWLTCCLRDATKLHQIGSDIDALKTKISSMSDRLKNYGVKSSDSNNVDIHNKMIADQRRTYCHVDGRDVVGLAQCVHDLGRQLRDGSESIVLIHGMGGIGKTTLAREIFNHTPLKEHFDGFAWAYISQQLQLGAVCREILLQLIPKERKEQREFVQGLQDSLLPGHLNEMLRQKNYLVVLDDLWFGKDWVCLEPAFHLSFSSPCSKLIVTTRDPQVLSSVDTHLVFTYQVKLLDRDMSWKLLQEKANFNKHNADHTMVELGDKMLDRCNGHTLAIVVLGRVLARKNNVEEWQSVADNLPAHLQRLQGDDSYMGVYDVLAMSYYELPYNIKPCFLLLGNFPEDSNIHVGVLNDMWIAEGIVSSTQDERVAIRHLSVEDICEVYLNELVQKGMVAVGERNIHGKISTCRLHDLMRDKCLELNKEENFLQIFYHQADMHEQNPTLDYTANEKLRRMAIYVDHSVPYTLPKVSLSGRPPPLRSLMFFNWSNQSNREDQDAESYVIAICKEFQLLRFLDFSGLHLKGCFPKEIGRLHFLRYLSLRDTHIIELPSSIGNLRYLMILDLRVHEVRIKIPNQLWKLKSLIHLYFPSRILSQEFFHQQGYKITDDEMLKLEQLGKLEKLEDVDLDRVDVKGLVELRSLRVLKASCIFKKESLDPFLKSKSIKTLSLKIHINLVIEEPMALAACDSLKDLDIDGERAIPIFVPMKEKMYPQSLQRLAFWYCEFPTDPMPLLETLPNLRNLELHVCYRGQELHCSKKGFPNLTHLILDGLFDLEEWTIEQGGLPKLENILIYNSQLRELPTILPPQVYVTCEPCVRGIERHRTCLYFNAQESLLIKVE